MRKALLLALLGLCSCQVQRPLTLAEVQEKRLQALRPHERASVEHYAELQFRKDSQRLTLRQPRGVR